MIPLHLEIEGFYSYKEKQTINFSELTAAGLFGIFGHVGSGKSSILEAILLSLYGSTERLSEKGEKGSMLNLESDQVKITFKFFAGKNNDSKYLATYTAKRKPKNPEEIKPAEHQLYVLEGDKIIPIEETAELILGMKKEHFNKTVIIPQGKFSEFLKLGPGPRADMMKELFGLEKYDLSQKTIGLFKKVNGEKEKVSAQFALYETLSTEVLAEKELEFNDLKEALATQELDLKKIQQELEKLGKAEQLFNQYQSFKSKLSSKSLQIPEMEKLKSQQEKYIKCSLEIHPLIQTRELYSKEYEECKFKITTTQSEIETLDFSINGLIKEEEKLLQQESKKAEKETKIKDLETVIQIISLQDALKQIDQKINEIELKLTDKNKELEILRNSLSGYEKEKEILNPPNLALFTTVKSAGSSWLSQLTQHEKLIVRIKEIKKEKISLEQTLKGYSNDLPTSFQSLEAYKENLQNDLDSLELKKEEWGQKQGLLNYSHHLHDGEECPLCGSKEHPNPLKSVENEVIEELNKKIIGTKAELEKIKERISNQKNILQQLEKNNAHLNTLSDDLEELESEISSNKKILFEQNIQSKIELENYIIQAEKLFEKKEILEKDIQSTRRNFEDLREKTQVFQNTQNKLVQDQAVLISKIDTLNTSLQYAEFCEPYFQKPIEHINADIEKVKNALFTLEEKLKFVQNELQNQRNLRAGIHGQNELLRSQIGPLETKFLAAEKSLQEKLINSNFTLEEVNQLLKEKLDELHTKKVIEEFENEMNFLSKTIADLEKNEEVTSFDPQVYQEHIDIHADKNNDFQSTKTKLALLEDEIKKYKEGLAIKSKLNVELEKLETRLMKIRELESLFKGSGFVKYVSNIYLKELCQTANIRFQQLTKNQLSMEVDEQNTFWVVDYLNSGKRRLLKSLSGGQTFQASLCLALALAERVKTLNRADKSFFFLDEGFGSLDKSSLRLVFETLKSLRQENRIVGIISHVEELQQEIGVYATVNLDPEKGSQVSYSFGNLSP